MYLDRYLEMYVEMYLRMHLGIYLAIYLVILLDILPYVRVCFKSLYRESECDGSMGIGAICHPWKIFEGFWDDRALFWGLRPQTKAVS